MKTVTVKVLCCLVLMLAAYACKQKELADKQTLVTYINTTENGLVKQEEVSGVVYSLKYRPLDLVMAQDLQGHPNLNRDSLRKSYEGCLYFVLSISKDSADVFGSLRGNYDALLNKISFQLKDNVRLFTNKTSAPFYLADFIYPRLYGTTASTSVLLCFKDKTLEDASDFTVSMKDLVNESDEELKFKFLKNDFENVPALKL